MKFFLDRGGLVEGKVYDEKYRPSPIPKGGLEIVLEVTFKIQDEKWRYLKRLTELITENYDIPKSILEGNSELELNCFRDEEENKKEPEEDFVAFFIDEDDNDE